MTGFGEASAQAGGVHYFVEIRSLNSKYFKPVVRLPEEYQGLDAEIEAALRRVVTRGTVTVICSCSDSSESAAYEINTKALEKYIEQIHQTPLVFKGSVTVDVAALLGLPGVLQPPANEEERIEAARRGFMPLLAKACDAMMAMRDVEGRALLDELRRQLTCIGERLAAIAERAPSVPEEYQRRLRSRIDHLLSEAGIRADPVDIIREVAVYAERTDLNEEISRLRGHIDQFIDLLNNDTPRPIGRTLDFLSQEMLREANTIASKSPDALISRQIVEVKGAIDRIKELVQNVE